MVDYLVFSGNNVLLPGNDSLQKATIVVDTLSGKIIIIRPLLPTSLEQLSNEFAPKTVQWVDAGDKLILPGLVEQVYLNYSLNRRTAWEGFFTGTRAALSGGITTLVDMPLNSLPPTTTVPNLAAKRHAAQGQCYTDVAFWGGVIPGNQGEDTVLLFHAELEADESDETPAKTESDPRQYATFLASRPQQLEIDAISLIIKLLREYPTLRCHIVHLSAASALPLIRDARAEGLPLTVETCFHYLCLAAEDIPSGHAEFKCCPPVRENSNRESLWDALEEGLIDFVVSDHSPCTLDLKKLDDGYIMSAWGGISTLGLGLSLLWTEGQKRGINIPKIIEWTSKNTAKHAGLGGSKGELAIGSDGDIIVWDPDYQYEVTNELLQFKNKISPYQGLKLYGRVEQVYLRGQIAFKQDTGFQEPIGRLL
ncbi:hypothetical protein CVT24_009425 [Panaeolus cyanescens]|uniref:Amidohydrolase-related domain-containing protein n=1 Tax=Panaeolus cyanescens TaxID=181874 RepID=A0A409VAR4_9AGAR|nr:hypothetical protein CVT24_009425 [Panaeolus cyanescens]